MADVPPGRRRPRFRVLEVASVERLCPWMVRIGLTGPDLDGLGPVIPTQHVKLLVPPPGAASPDLPPPEPDGATALTDGIRASLRTYTVRRHDLAAGRLDIDVALHGAGVVSSWAESVAPGVRVALAGPGGRMSLEPGPGRWVLAGDESAVPAIASLLDALPRSAEADVVIEATRPGDPVPLTSEATLRTLWLAPEGAPGDALAGSVLDRVDGASAVWVACEAGAVRRIRRDVLATGLARERLVTRGYWRLGATNHPDHDFGEDEAA